MYGSPSIDLTDICDIYALCIAYAILPIKRVYNRVNKVCSFSCPITYALKVNRCGVMSTTPPTWFLSLTLWRKDANTSHTHTYTHSLSQSHTHKVKVPPTCWIVSLSLSLSLTHTHTHSFSLTVKSWSTFMHLHNNQMSFRNKVQHTHTHTHTHTQIHLLFLSLFLIFSSFLRILKIFLSFCLFTHVSFWRRGVTRVCCVHETVTISLLSTSQQQQQQHRRHNSCHVIFAVDS